MASLFSSSGGSGGASGTGWFPMANWPGTDKAPMTNPKLNPNNGTFNSRTSASKGPDTGVKRVDIPEPNPAFHAGMGLEDTNYKPKTYIDEYGNRVEPTKAKRIK